MNNTFELYIGIDVSKGKADAAILQVYNLRSMKPKFLRKNYLLNLLSQRRIHS